jgi:hypothetical protein
MASMTRLPGYARHYITQHSSVLPTGESKMAMVKSPATPIVEVTIIKAAPLVALMVLQPVPLAILMFT